MKVTESAKLLLDGGQQIPCDLLAKILKFQLLQIRSKDQQRREAEGVKKFSTFYMLERAASYLTGGLSERF